MQRKTRKRTSEPKIEVTPFAWRDPKTGVLFMEIPFRRDFNTMLKECVPSRYRAYQEVEAKKLWLVSSGYAESIEDLLETYWPEIIIDYQGWNPKNDVIDETHIPPPQPRVQL